MKVYLTKKQAKVFMLYKSGMSQKEIGIQLGISQACVWRHLERVRVKLGIKNIKLVCRKKDCIPIDIDWEFIRDYD
tara:strand:+ start:1267 stop:1494 length:228 start_codon:yes stop_codon:yes gene_type:complete